MKVDPDYLGSIHRRSQRQCLTDAAIFAGAGYEYPLAGESPCKFWFETELVNFGAKSHFVVPTSNKKCCTMYVVELAQELGSKKNGAVHKTLAQRIGGCIRST